MTESEQHPIALRAAVALDQVPEPRIYANPQSLRLLYVNTAAASDLGKTKTQLTDTYLPDLLSGIEVQQTLARAEQENRSQRIARSSDLPAAWRALNIEHAGSGLTRFVKVTVERAPQAPPAFIDQSSYDRTASGLLEHALAQLCEQGSQQFSVRKVAARAGVGLGHLQYYYRTRFRLLQAMADATTFEMLAYFEAHIAPRPDPGSRLLGVIDYVLNREEHGHWLTAVREFRVMARDDRALRPLLAALFEECRRLFGTLFRGINPELDESQVIAIASEALSLLSDADEFGWQPAAQAAGREASTEAPDYRSHLTARILGLVHGSVANTNQALDVARARTAEQVEALMTVAQSMVDQRTSAARLQAVCTAATRLLDSDHASIFLATDGYFTGCCGFGDPALGLQAIAGGLMRREHPLLAAAIATGEPVVVNDVHNSALVDASLAQQTNIHALAVVALFDPDGAACGFISSEYKQRLGGFGDLQSQLLLGLARLSETVLHSDTVSNGQ